MSDKIWDKQYYETDICFAHFQKYYLLQAEPRSLTDAYRRFRLEKGDKPPEVVKKLYASGSWSNWANGKDREGNKIPGAYTWNERAKAYDESLFLVRQQDYESSKQELLENEINDATLQLELWKFASRSFDTLVKHKKAEFENEKKVFDPSSIISKGRELMKWREDIAVFSRRTLKLPSTIRDFGSAKEEEKAPKIEWDEPLGKEDEIGIGSDELEDYDEEN